MTDEIFGMPEEELSFGEVVEESVSIEDLEATIEDCNKQLAMTMDEKVQAQLRPIRDAAKAELAAARGSKVGSKTAGQWADLERAYSECHGNTTEFAAILDSMAALNKDEVYETMVSLLSKTHALTAKPAKEKAKKEKAIGTSSTPEGRWPHIVEHGKNIGQDAQVVFDELGFSKVDDNACNEVLREMNNRANGTPQAAEEAEEVEEFGIAVVEPAPTQYSVDEETGEVMDLPWVLQRLGWTEFPTAPDRDKADKIVDLLHSYLEPAARYRAQAEKRAKPLESRAEAIEKVFGPYLNAVGADEKHGLPRFKSGAKAGEFSKKTLDLASGSISWTKDGGISCSDEGKFFGWLKRKEDEWYQQHELLKTGDAKQKELAQQIIEELTKKYGFRIETKAVINRDFIKATKDPKQLPDGWSSVGVNHFARRVIK